LSHVRQLDSSDHLLWEQYIDTTAHGQGSEGFCTITSYRKCTTADAPTDTIGTAAACPRGGLTVKRKQMRMQLKAILNRTVICHGAECRPEPKQAGHEIQFFYNISAFTNSLEVMRQRSFLEFESKCNRLHTSVRAAEQTQFRSLQNCNVQAHATMDTLAAQS
jgi:hypothetical protein